MKKIAVTMTLLSIFIFTTAARAYVMSSPNYRMQSDSINVGGGQGSSPQYNLSDTVGEVASGDSASQSYGVRAGFQAMQVNSIAITPGDLSVALGPSIGSVSGGIANGQAEWKVTTDDPAGYSIIIKALDDPNLKDTKGNTFSNYTTNIVGVPDFDWTISPNSSEFGFSVFGDGLTAKYKNDGTACGVGNQITALRCWFYLAKNNETIVKTNTSNHPNGTTTTVQFRAESGNKHVQPVGAYTATIVITAIPN